MNHSTIPNPSDAILGGKTPPPVTGAILGGLAGAQQRLESEATVARLSALKDAMQYGEKGIELAAQALSDPAEEVQRFACKLLRQQGSDRAQEALLQHQPLSYFTRLSNWRLETYNPQVGLADPENNAYEVRLESADAQDPCGLAPLEALLRDERLGELEAIAVRIGSVRGASYHAFGAAMEALCDAKEQLPKLKALYIGDGNADVPAFKKSKMAVFGIRPFLEAFPQLELLQVFGNFGRDEIYLLDCAGLRHEQLKTLIIEAAYIDGRNLEQMCSLDLPNLECFELWLGCSWGSQAVPPPLEPILAKETYPKLKYLGLCSAERPRAIIEGIVDSPLMGQLAVLDLKMGTLQDGDIELLTNAEATESLKLLEVTGNQLSREAVAQLNQQCYQVSSDYQFTLNEFPDYEDEDYNDEGYNAVGTTRHCALYE